MDTTMTPHESEDQERQALLMRLDRLVTSRLVREGAASASLRELRVLVTGVERTDALNKKYGRMQAMASPEAW